MVMSTVTDQSAECGEVQREEAMLKSTPEVNLTELPNAGSPTQRTLFDTEESNLLRFAFSLSGCRAVAEEIVQEVFLQLHAKWSEVNEPRAWLFRSVRNRAFHYLRKSRRETLVSDDDGTPIADSADVTPDELIARMETVAELRLRIVQGQGETISLGLGGVGDVIDFQGESIASWAVRTADSHRYLDLELKPTEAENGAGGKTADAAATIHIRSKQLESPARVELAHLMPGKSLGFDSRVQIQYVGGEAGKIVNTDGFAPLVSSNAVDRLQTATGGRLELLNLNSGPVYELVFPKTGSFRIDVDFEAALKTDAANWQGRFLAQSVVLK